MTRQRDTSLVSERYLMHEYALNLSRRLALIMWDLGSRRSRKGFSDELGENLTGRVALDGGKHRPAVHFSNWRYSPSLSSFKYHRDRAKSTESMDGEERAKPIKNHTSSRIKRSLEHQVAKRHVESYHMNTTISTELTSRTKFGGSYGGGSFEQEIEATFGTSIEAGSGGEDETSETETVTDEIVVKVGKQIIPIRSNKTRFVETPYEIDAYVDVDVTMFFERNANGWERNGRLLWTPKHQYDKAQAGDGRKITFTGIRAILQWLNGYNVRFPRMAEYHRLRSPEAEEAWRWIEDNRNRRIMLEGVREDRYETNGALDVIELDLTD